jgi:uncharacterized peroxidase-related enzyme
MPRIKVIPYQQAEGTLKVIYDDLLKKRGKLANVHTIQSLRPQSIVKHMELYMEIMFSKSELSRAEREMMAVVVSVANGCKYCRLHHAEALNHYWKNEQRLSLLINDFRSAGLDDKKIALCTFAHELTRHPEKFSDDALINIMKEAGLSDSAILDATLVVSYFNFVNRIVMALDVESSEEEVKGYDF